MEAVEAVEAFTAWLRGLPPLGIYAAVFAISWGENVIPPIPGDIAVVIAGSFVALGLVGLVPLFVVATVGSVLGFLTMYAVGRRLGEAVHDPARLRWIPRGPVAAVDRWLKTWGLAVVAANRFLSGGRAVIALLTGSAKLSLSAVTLWSTVSAIAWNAVLIGGGYAVGSEWDRVAAFLKVYGRTVTGVLAFVALVLIARHLWKRHRARATV